MLQTDQTTRKWIFFIKNELHKVLCQAWKNEPVYFFLQSNSTHMR